MAKMKIITTATKRITLTLNTNTTMKTIINYVHDNSPQFLATAVMVAVYSIAVMVA